MLFILRKYCFILFICQWLKDNKFTIWGPLLILQHFNIHPKQILHYLEVILIKTNRHDTPIMIMWCQDLNNITVSSALLRSLFVLLCQNISHQLKTYYWCMTSNAYNVFFNLFLGQFLLHYISMKMPTGHRRSHLVEKSSSQYSSQSTSAGASLWKKSCRIHHLVRFLSTQVAVSDLILI